VAKAMADATRYRQSRMQLPVLLQKTNSIRAET